MIEELLREYNATSDSYPIRQAFAVLEARAEAAEARVAGLEAALAAERAAADTHDVEPDTGEYK